MNSQKGKYFFNPKGNENKMNSNKNRTNIESPEKKSTNIKSPKKQNLKLEINPLNKINNLEKDKLDQTRKINKDKDDNLNFRQRETNENTNIVQDKNINTNYKENKLEKKSVGLEDSELQYLISTNERENIDFIDTLLKLKGYRKDNGDNKLEQTNKLFESENKMNIKFLVYDLDKKTRNNSSTLKSNSCFFNNRNSSNTNESPRFCVDEKISYKKVINGSKSIYENKKRNTTPIMDVLNDENKFCIKINNNNNLIKSKNTKTEKNININKSKITNKSRSKNTEKDKDKGNLKKSILHEKENKENKENQYNKKPKNYGDINSKKKSLCTNVDNDNKMSNNKNNIKKIKCGIYYNKKELSVNIDDISYSYYSNLSNIAPYKRSIRTLTNRTDILYSDKSIKNLSNLSEPKGNSNRSEKKKACLSNNIYMKKNHKNIFLSNEEINSEKINSLPQRYVDSFIEDNDDINFNENESNKLKDINIIDKIDKIGGNLRKSIDIEKNINVNKNNNNRKIISNSNSINNSNTNNKNIKTKNEAIIDKEKEKEKEKIKKPLKTKNKVLIESNYINSNKNYSIENKINNNDCSNNIKDISNTKNIKYPKKEIPLNKISIIHEVDDEQKSSIKNNHKNYNQELNFIKDNRNNNNLFKKQDEKKTRINITKNKDIDKVNEIYSSQYFGNNQVCITRNKYQKRLSNINNSSGNNNKKQNNLISPNSHDNCTSESIGQDKKMSKNSFISQNTTFNNDLVNYKASEKNVSGDISNVNNNNNNTIFSIINNSNIYSFNNDFQSSINTNSFVILKNNSKINKNEEEDLCDLVGVRPEDFPIETQTINNKNNNNNNNNNCKNNNNNVILKCTSFHENNISKDMSDIITESRCNILNDNNNPICHINSFNSGASNVESITNENFPGDDLSDINAFDIITNQKQNESKEIKFSDLQGLKKNKEKGIDNSSNFIHSLTNISKLTNFVEINSKNGDISHVNSVNSKSSFKHVKQYSKEEKKLLPPNNKPLFKGNDSKSNIKKLNIETISESDSNNNTNTIKIPFKEKEIKEFKLTPNKIILNIPDKKIKGIKQEQNIQQSGSNINNIININNNNGGCNENVKKSDNININFLNTLLEDNKDNNTINDFSDSVEGENEAIKENKEIKEIKDTKENKEDNENNKNNEDLSKNKDNNTPLHKGDDQTSNQEIIINNDDEPEENDNKNPNNFPLSPIKLIIEKDDKFPFDNYTNKNNILEKNNCLKRDYPIDNIKGKSYRNSNISDIGKKHLVINTSNKLEKGKEKEKFSNTSNKQSITNTNHKEFFRNLKKDFPIISIYRKQKMNEDEKIQEDSLKYLLETNTRTNDIDNNNANNIEEKITKYNKNQILLEDTSKIKMGIITKKEEKNKTKKGLIIFKSHIKNTLSQKYLDSNSPPLTHKINLKIEKPLNEEGGNNNDSPRKTPKKNNNIYAKIKVEAKNIKIPKQKNNDKSYSPSHTNTNSNNSTNNINSKIANKKKSFIKNIKIENRKGRFSSYQNSKEKNKEVGCLSRGSSKNKSIEKSFYSKKSGNSYKVNKKIVKRKSNIYCNTKLKIINNFNNNNNISRSSSNNKSHSNSKSKSNSKSNSNSKNKSTIQNKKSVPNIYYPNNISNTLSNNNSNSKYKKVSENKLIENRILKTKMVYSTSSAKTKKKYYFIPKNKINIIHNSNDKNSHDNINTNYNIYNNSSNVSIYYEGNKKSLDPEGLNLKVNNNPTKFINQDQKHNQYLYNNSDINIFSGNNAENILNIKKNNITDIPKKRCLNFNVSDIRTNKKIEATEENDEFSAETKNENDLNEYDKGIYKDNNTYLRAKAELDFLDRLDINIISTKKIKTSCYNPNNLIINSIKNQKH